MLTTLLLLAAGIILYRWHRYRVAQRAWHEAQWNCEDGAALKAFAIHREQEERRALLIAWSPGKAWAALSLFVALALVMLWDTWGTQGVYLSWFAAAMTIVMLGGVVHRHVYRQRALKATVQAAPRAPVAGARARRLPVPCVPPR